VADLSAEIYYHWLLEHWPRLGLALERLPGHIDRQQLRVWHNGGRGRFVAEGLQQRLGLRPEQLMAADDHPHISARLLLVPDFCGRFGIPAPQAVHWLREQVHHQASERPPHRRLWLSRSRGWRRAIVGEAATLERLRPWGLERVDPGRLSLEQQAALLTEAELVVLPHGGALANLVFAQPGTRVLELHGPHYHPPYIHGLAQSLHLRLASCEQPQRPPRLYREWLYEAPILEPIVLEPERIAACLTELLSQHSNR
jgi:capsular polysaccharide biosynthesis protein